jgi:hypothetical protein
MTKSTAVLLLPAPPATMICFLFVRRGDMLRVEVGADERTHEFALVVKEGSGRQRRDEFADVEALQQGLAQMSTRLQQERWVPAGLPIEIREAAAPEQRKGLWQRAGAVLRKILQSISVAYLV